MSEASSIRQLHDELKRIEQNMATKKDIEALTDTVEFLSNPETMKQIADSMEDIRHGRVRKINSAQDLLNEK